MDTITLKEAEQLVSEWQAKLQDAQTALARHEEQIGQRALDEGVDVATEQLTRLQVEVRMCETALAKAQAQRAAARRHEQEARIAKLRADAADLWQRAEEAAAIFNELSPRLAQARLQMEQLTAQSLAAQRQAERLEERLQEEVAA